jgi:hypothetical protein
MERSSRNVLHLCYATALMIEPCSARPSDSGSLTAGFSQLPNPKAGGKPAPVGVNKSSAAEMPVTDDVALGTGEYDGAGATMRMWSNPLTLCCVYGGRGHHALRALLSAMMTSCSTVPSG